MTPPISAPSWVKPLLLAAGLVMLAVVAMQVAGLVFCGWTGAARPQEVTPFTFYRYWYWYRQHPAWQSYIYGSGAAGVLALLMPVAVVLAPGRKQKLHGEARWARRRQVRAAGLMGTAGIIVGKLGGRFLMFEGNEQGKNVMVAAAPGSGKTQGLMIPNCLNWPGSLVALDIKGECYERTAGYRQSTGQQVFQIDFLSRDYRTHRYNPFAYVSEDKNFRVGDIEKIAQYLLPLPSGSSDPFWATSARDMFRALALYLLDTSGTCTLGGILDLAETPEELQRFARRIVREATAAEITLDPQSIRDFAAVANRPDKTHGGVKDNLTGALAPLKNPLVRYATEGNTFDMRELRMQPMSIYMTVKKPDLPALRPDHQPVLPAACRPQLAGRIRRPSVAQARDPAWHGRICTAGQARCDLRRGDLSCAASAFACWRSCKARRSCGPRTPSKGPRLSSNRLIVRCSTRQRLATSRPPSCSPSCSATTLSRASRSPSARASRPSSTRPASAIKSAR